MTLGELSDLAQVIEAVAVVVSILYLALQIRQNTRALRLTVHHARSGDLSLGSGPGSKPRSLS